MSHYVVKNPRGHRQAGASNRALTIRSQSPHAHLVKKEDEPVGKLKRVSHADCNTSERVERRTPFGVESEYYCFTHMEHVYGFAGGVG